jgi:NAD(P)H dehydrogenase (quinone)
MNGKRDPAGPEGAPYTHYGAVLIKTGDDDQRKRARILGERLACKGLQSMIS